MAFAREHSIAICYDNPYIDIVFDGAKPLSILSIEGAKEVAVELNSFSKPFNMCGWRLGMALGNPTAIAAMAQVKSNTDSGVFNAMQYAGIAALTAVRAGGGEDAPHLRSPAQAGGGHAQLASAGSARRRRARSISGCRRRAAKSSADFAAQLFEKAHIVVAPGSAYGKFGEGYIRLSLTITDDRLEQAMDRLRKAFG